LDDAAATSNALVSVTPATARAAVSYAYAWRFLWGFMWRSSVCTLPLWFVGPFLYLAVFPADALGDPLTLLQPENLLAYAGSFLLVSGGLTLLSILLMVVAMRWTLNDFRRHS
jgi:hypothetical protein